MPVYFMIMPYVLCVEKLEAVADRGYYSAEEIHACESAVCSEAAFETPTLARHTTKKRIACSSVRLARSGACGDPKTTPGEKTSRPDSGPVSDYVEAATGNSFRNLTASEPSSNAAKGCCSRTVPSSENTIKAPRSS